MLWEEYYDKIGEWTTSTAVGRMSQLASFGPPDEIIDAINTIGFDDKKGATRLLKKATAAGVKFSGAQLSELFLICEEESLNRAIRFSSDRFTEEDLDALYCSCDDDILMEISQQQNIKLPKDLADHEDAVGEATLDNPEITPVQNKHGYCPNCGSFADSNFCPNCGADLRKTTGPMSATGANTNDYSSYFRFYPNKIKAIQALRIDTGLNAAEAKKIIDQLFGANVFPKEPTFAHSSKWKKASLPSQSQYPGTIEVDTSYYANKFYPRKTEAIRALQQLGVGPVDAHNAIEDAFREIEEQTKKVRQDKVSNAAKAIGKGIGLAALFSGYGIFRIITGLVKPYMGKRK